MKTGNILVMNAGSSSIKYAFFEDNALLPLIRHGMISDISTASRWTEYAAGGGEKKIKPLSGATDYENLYQQLFEDFRREQISVNAVGHRVVHGGDEYHAPVKVTEKILCDLKKYVSYAPLHQPYNLQAIDIIHKLLPTLPQVACFDTAFHRTHPRVADQFGLPAAYTDAGIHRFGFHGLSYEYIVYYLKKQSIPFPAKLIVAHLGNGASLCAIRNGESVDSTMGFSALDGLIMGTRCGNVDPGVILYLLQERHMTPEAIQDLLYYQSGLLGVSGISSNMQVLLTDTRPKAKEAVTLFVYRICREIGALVSVLKGLDMLVFTGGIGQNSAIIRQAVGESIAWLGVSIHPEKNKQGEEYIQDTDSRIKVCVIPTNEEKMIAMDTYRFLH